MELSLSPEQELAMGEYAAGKNIFLTGPGGSGKTELIKRMVGFPGKKVQVCALTGCAALLLNCKAKTVHSWAGIGLGTAPNEDIVDKIMLNKYKKNNWTGIDVLIIDEVSMMSAKLFNLLDLIGRKTHPKTRCVPFGGLQIVFSGDFYQLPPVCSASNATDDADAAAFCFESANWKSTFECTIQLKTIFRQTDPVYTKILNQVRVGTLYRSSLETLMEHVNKPAPVGAGVVFRPTILLPRRKDADLINASEMAKLPGEEKKYKRVRAQECDIVSSTNTYGANSSSSSSSPQQLDMEYNSLVSNIIAEEELILKKGAQVMCIVNIDTAQNENGSLLMINNTMVVNGSQGVVVDFIRDLPVVQFNNGIKRVMGHHIWASETFPTVGVKQIPLIHAWAITIHKSQGVTLEMAQIDAGSSIFECGQTYVALSRVKSLDGLYLTALNPQKIRVNKKVQEFYASL